MLGFFPLGSYELESPADLTEFRSNTYILGAVTLAGLALSGGKPLSIAAEFAAEASSTFSATATALHLTAAMQASPTASFALLDAVLHRAPTMRAAAAVNTAAQAWRLNLAHLHLVASASASIDAGAVYTIHLPRALSAASSSAFDVTPIYAVPLPRALFAAAEATISASANVTRTPNFVASGVVDLALGQANLRRPVLFDAGAQVQVAGGGYLTRAADMRAGGSSTFTGAVSKINLERWLTATPTVDIASFGALGVPVTLRAVSSAEMAAGSPTDTPKEQTFPLPNPAFSQVWVGDYYKLGSYVVRYDVYVLLREQQVVDETPVDTPLAAVQAAAVYQEALVPIQRLAVITLPLEEVTITVPLEEDVVDV